VRNKINKLSVSGVFECACIECNLENTACIIATIYRPPKGDLTVFFKKLETMLEEIFKYIHVTIFIAGDFNIELLESNSTRTQILSVMSSFGIYPTILENTRITSSCKSCIDNIFTNIPESKINSCVLNTTISDHTAQKITFYLERDCSKRCYYKRFFSKENNEQFYELIGQQQWLDVFDAPRFDVDQQWSLFSKTFLAVFHHCFPKKLYNPDYNRNFLYKCNNQVQEAKNQLDVLLMLKCQNERDYKERYSLAKTEYEKLLIKVRSDHYSKKINNSENKNKCMWTIFKEISNKPNINDTKIPGFTEETADSYNEYLLAIIPELCKGTGQAQWDTKIKRNVESMQVRPISVDEILECTKKIKPKSSSGDDEIPSRLVCQTMPAMAEIICYIINNSLKEGIFPTNLKLAVIKPIYKNKGDSTYFQNYRPISLLPAFFKLFEIVMCKQLTEFMNECSLLAKSQHGYIQKRSTQTAIFAFTQTILEYLDDGDVTLGLFLDLSKAF